MDVDDPIVTADFDGRIPKGQSPRPESDWATVDVDAGPRQVVVLGCVLNGDSRHELACRDIAFRETEAVTRLSIAIEIEEHDPDGALIMSGPGEYYYRLGIEFEDAIPLEYRIRHFDENGTEQLDAKEILFARHGEYSGDGG